uniref:Large ribosomal subunit protein uL6c n=1 Tax=Yamadaella caenomyce TaxID=259029 RepID=A0A1G4NYU2_9FLOR|nr:Ribosomal protein L6 [Yamadaella caenomyce]SCW23850.1 Ribosomal protein L6 [Yamadaella caenomyce]
MSRIGKQDIILFDKINASIEEQIITIEGPKGILTEELSNLITIKQYTNNDVKVISLKRKNDSKEARQLHGLSRTLVNNMVTGVSQGFYKVLEIRGVGYRSHMDGKNLILNVGYSHPVTIAPPTGISIQVENNTNIKVEGINKCLVGEIAAKIRSTRPPEPYKGKGIRYRNEIVKKKIGKAGK